MVNYLVEFEHILSFLQSVILANEPFEFCLGILISFLCDSSAFGFYQVALS